MKCIRGLLIAALLVPAGLVRGEADVPSGAVSYSQHLEAGQMTPPAVSLSNPYSGDADAAAAGEKLFAAMNCDGCHGGGALGFTAPSLADGRWRFGGEDSAVFHSIFYGRPHGMPAYGGILPATAVWMLVTYVTTRPVPREVPTAAWQTTS
jgi:cytochrome c oxidase cbb3-type subunit 3